MFSSKLLLENITTSITEMEVIIKNVKLIKFTKKLFHIRNGVVTAVFHVGPNI